VRERQNAAARIDELEGQLADLQAQMHRRERLLRELEAELDDAKAGESEAQDTLHQVKLGAEALGQQLADARAVGRRSAERKSASKRESPGGQGNGPGPKLIPWGRVGLGRPKRLRRRR
jgi:peptidoglycan hydrolase CwlO-like protein